MSSKSNKMERDNKPRVLAVIPARGGSKRLPRKNIMCIAGHSMIAYSIYAAKESENITDLVISSEDDEILEVAKQYGASMLIKRPKELATDNVRNISVVSHALKKMEADNRHKYDMIVLLQPTSPVRSSRQIDQAIEKLWKSKLDSLASVKGPFQKKDPIIKKINKKGEMVAYCQDSETNQSEPFYVYNAALYIVKRDYFVEEEKFISDKQVPLVMDKYHSIDVDEMADFIVAEEYIKFLGKNKEL
jgi:CMP-N-acetylneuraminic acid synthetase